MAGPTPSTDSASRPSEIQQAHHSVLLVGCECIGELSDQQVLAILPEPCRRRAQDLARPSSVNRYRLSQAANSSIVRNTQAICHSVQPEYVVVQLTSPWRYETFVESVPIVIDFETNTQSSVRLETGSPLRPEPAEVKSSPPRVTSRQRRAIARVFDADFQQYHLLMAALQLQYFFQSRQINGSIRWLNHREPDWKRVRRSDSLRHLALQLNPEFCDLRQCDLNGEDTVRG